MKSKKLSSMVLIALIGLSMPFMAGCQETLVLESEPETLETIRCVFDAAAYYRYDEPSEIYVVYDSGRNHIGYLFYAEGMGETVPAGEGLSKVAGPIVILVGLKDAETIEDIYVVSHSETDVYWRMLVNKDYFKQFEGLRVEDAYFRHVGGEVDRISGATLSSKLVLNTVRVAAQEKAVYIKEGLR
jgi:Na+-translocating ferredoxin:NAD+ oxidoreductase RnfG subunit